jgi:AbrB family looped-hinge helix DNA binding protein
LWVNSLIIVEVDDRHRITLPKEVRENFNLSKGEKLYIIPAGDSLILKKIPKNPSESLRKLLGETDFDREARRKAEKWLLNQTSEK